MMKSINKLLIVASCSLMLTACADMNSDFSCPMKPGVSCESLDSVNSRVDRNDFSSSTMQRSQLTESIQAPSLVNNVAAGGRYPRSPLRASDRVLPIWIGSYVDDNDNYHTGGYIYTVLGSPHWAAANLG